jgi:uncharacterized protein YegP (UPF0339 family)
VNARERLLLTGQLYATRSQCVEAVHELLTTIFEESSPVRTVSGATWCFAYYNEHHEKTGTSEVFQSRAAMEHAIHAVKKNVPSAVIEDQASHVTFLHDRE